MSILDNIVEAMQEQDAKKIGYYHAQINSTMCLHEVFIHPEFLPTLMDIFTQFYPEENDNRFFGRICRLILLSCCVSRSIAHYIQEWIPELLVFSMRK